MGITYKDSGVDIEAGERAVGGIRDLARSTYSKSVLTDVGTFGSMFRFPSESFDDPVLVSSTDGVGTKTLVANLTGVHNSVGRDLVHHCVDDILTTGAKPLFFLDYP